MKPKLKFKKRELPLVYGLVMGDGSVYNSGKGNCFLDIAHCPKQLDYLRWKKDLLSSLGIDCKIKYKPATVNSNYAKYRLCTPRSIAWTEIRAKLYSFRNTKGKSKKRITKGILKDFTLLTLLLLYLDDGYNNQTKNYVQLGVYALSVPEAELLRDWIFEKTGAEFKVYKRKGQPFLVSYRDAKIFKGALSGVCDVPECMKYKLT